MFNFYTKKVNLKIFELMTSRSTSAKRSVKTIVRPIKETIVKNQITTTNYLNELKVNLTYYCRI